MDSARFGPVFLKQEAIAELVVESLFKGVELGHYQLGPFVIMSNHVHVLLLPAVPPSRLLKSLKGYTARQANLLLGRTGETFWQRESYDHVVRSPEEFQKISAYIENNPVKAGVVDQAGITHGPARIRSGWSACGACVHKIVNAARRRRALLHDPNYRLRQFGGRGAFAVHHHCHSQTLVR